MLTKATFTDMRNSTEEDWKIILNDFPEILYAER